MEKKYFFRHPKQRAEVSLKLSEAVLALREPDEGDIPKQHRLDVSTVTHQTLGVFSRSIRKYTNDTMFIIFKTKTIKHFR